MRYANARGEVGKRSYDCRFSSATDRLFLVIFTGLLWAGRLSPKATEKHHCPF